MKTEDIEELIFLWREYATEKDKYLTGGAIELKKKILAFVESLPDLPNTLQTPPS